MGISNDIRKVASGWRWGRRRLTPASVGDRFRETPEFPTQWARSPAGMAARRFILRAGFGPLLAYEVNREVHGLDHLDEIQTPVLFSANHTSHLDAPLILTSLPEKWRERTAVGAAADYFFDVWWRAAATALAFAAFPVERGGSKRSSGLAAQLISEGWSILVFPEGTRSRDGWVGDFRHGTARLAIQNNIPVVPIGITGSYQAMPRGKGWPASGRPPVWLRFGRPVYPNPSEEPEQMSKRIIEGLEFCLEEQRSNWWEAMRKKASSSLPAATGPEAATWRRMWESSRPVVRKEKVWRK